MQGPAHRWQIGLRDSARTHDECAPVDIRRQQRVVAQKAGADEDRIASVAERDVTGDYAFRYCIGRVCWHYTALIASSSLARN